MMNLIDFRKDIFSVTDTGLVRQANEDNCYAAETPNGFLFVVCDGMGGHVGGTKASATAVNAIVNFFTKEKYAVIHQALEDALMFANKQILQTAKENPELKGMGTTACIVLLRDYKAWYAHIGDSRIYLFCHKQQQLHRLTKDHSVVQGLVDQGIISEAEAEGHPNKNRILKTLGIKKDIQPDICTTPVHPAKGDILLICSDGLTGMVNDDILQHILTQKIPLQEKGENMLSSAKQAGGTDNITIQLIHISNSPHQNSVFESKKSSISTHSNKNTKKTFWIIAVALVLLVIVLGTTFVLLRNNPVIETEGSSESSRKQFDQEWEKRIEAVKIERGYTKAVKMVKGEGVVQKIDKSMKIKAIFNQTGECKNNESFEGMVIYDNDDYKIGNITIEVISDLKYRIHDMRENRIEKSDEIKKLNL